MTAADIPLFADDPAWKKSCEGKNRYSSEQSARDAAQFTIRKQGETGPRRLWVYPCCHCRRWHLTSMENPRTLAVTARWLVEGVR